MRPGGLRRLDPPYASGVRSNMPVRFRCAYCNQLLGIARRKVGTVVRCPTCAGQVVVPDRDAEDLDKGNDQPEPPLFERQDFDDLFNAPHRPDLEKGDEPQQLGPPVAVEQPVGAWGTHCEPEFDVQKLRPIPESESQKGGTNQICCCGHCRNRRCCRGCGPLERR